MNADVRELCGVSAATANRILAGLVNEGKLVKRQEESHWAYKMIVTLPKKYKEEGTIWNTH